MAFKFKKYTVVCLFFLAGFIGIYAQNEQINDILKSLQKKYAPDRRIVVYDICYKEAEESFVLTGEVENIAVKDAVIEELRKNFKKRILDSIKVLPDQKLGAKTNGIILSDVGCVRIKPSEEEELVTQVLMGTVVKVFKKRNGYYYIKMPDNYLGWIAEKQVYITDINGVGKWNNAKKMIVMALSGTVRIKPDTSSAELCSVVAGCILKRDGANNGWTSVELANGRRGFLPDAEVQDLKEWNQNRRLTGENLENTAVSLLGIPYQWGGTSVKGMDCSGFIKTVFRMNGRELQRDANQQAEEGIHVEAGKDFENLRKGDLLFFGQKGTKSSPEIIDHVGMYLEKRLFIHSSGSVRYGSFDSSSKYFNKSLLKKFVRARRIF